MAIATHPLSSSQSWIGSSSARLLVMCSGLALLGGCLVWTAPDDDDDAVGDDDDAVGDDDDTVGDDDDTVGDDDDATEPDLFPVAVNATGFEGFYARQVTVQLNGAQDLVVSGDGTYTFPEGVVEGGAYEVTVASAISLEACTLTDASGTLDVAALPEVGITCAPMEWEGPTELDQWEDVSPAVDVQTLRSASDSTGRMVVSIKDTADVCLLGEYEDGAWTWSPAGPSWATVVWHAVGTSDTGDVLFVWRDASGALFVSHRQGGVWTHPADSSDRIDPESAGAAERPAVAMNAQGDAVVVWRGYDGSAWQIFVSEYTGGSWTHPTDLSDNLSVDGISGQYPDVALSDSGDAAAVWQAAGSVYVADRRNGVWTQPTTADDAVSPPSTYVAEVPDVAMDGVGTTLVTWVQDVGPELGERVAYLSEYRSGTWTHPGVDDYVTPLGTTRGEEVVDPNVFFDGLGNGFLVWSGRGYVSISEHRGGVWNHPTSYEDNIVPAAWRGPNPNYISSWGTNARGDVVLLWQHQPQSVPCNGGGLCNALYRSEYRDGEWRHPQAETEAVSVLGTDAQSWKANLSATSVADDGTTSTLWKGQDGTGDCDGSPCDRVYTTVLR